MDHIVPDNPRRAYDMKAVIQAVMDRETFLEIQPDYARNIVVGYARLNGRVVGVIANQPMVSAGCLDINASDKAARFIRVCDCFNTPIITFVDVPGFLPGTTQEHGGIIRHGAKLLFAYSEATVPKISVVTRKAYGGAYIGMCSRSLGADSAFAWPSAEVAVMGAEGAANIIFRKEIQAAENPESKRQEKIQAYEKLFNGPFFAAEQGYVDEIIHPSQTRDRLIRALNVCALKRQTLPEKKHGNIPL